MSNENDYGQVYATKKMKESEILTLQEQHKDDYITALQDFDRQTTELVEHRRTGVFGRQKEDSDDMKQVKSTLSGLYQNMHEVIPFTTDTAQVKAEFTAIMSAYADTLRACEQYMKTHKDPWTKAGKARLAMVRQMYSLVKNDQKMIPDCARRLYEQAKTDPTQPIVWGNLLHEARCVRLQTDLKTQTDSGGGTSSVYKLTNGTATAYFKQNEYSPLREEDARAKNWCDAEKSRDGSLETAADQLYHWISTGIDSVPYLGNIRNAMRRLGLPGDGKTLLTKEQLDTALQSSSIKTALERIDARSALRTPKGFALLLRAANALPKLETMALTCQTANITVGRSMAERNVATSRVARLLGMGDMIAESHRARLQDTGSDTQLDGIVMKEARGKNYAAACEDAEREKKPLEYTAAVVQQLSNLHLLDALCGQIDRNMGNYMVQSHAENNRTILTGITAIDNDMSFGLHHYQDIRFGKQELPAIENRQTGMCNLPCISSTVYHRLQAMEENELRFILQDVLEKDEIDALWERRCGLLAMLERTRKANEAAQDGSEAPVPKFLISDSEWQTEFYRYREAVFKGKALSYADPTHLPQRQAEHAQ